MSNNYEENQIFFYSLEIKYSFEEGCKRKKKSIKLMEKKSRRSQHCFGHSRVRRASIEIRSRKKGRKINYESKYGYIDFDENTPEDKPYKPMEINKTRRPKMFSLYELMGDFCFNLPEELIIEILSRLPIKILARFTCVPKLWRRVISNVPVTNTPKLLIFAHSKEYKEISFYSVDNEANVKSVCCPVEEHLLLNHKVHLHSSCHGLLLIQIDNDLFIWNPLTYFFKKVLTIRQFNNGNNNCHFLVNLCLCYCSVSEEYKVVLEFHSWSNSYSSYTHEFYIATCGESSWEKIENVNFEDLKEGPFFKGYRHWSCSSHEQVVYFDPSTNKFIEVAMPHRKEDRKNYFLYLGVFDECLCITRGHDDPESYERKLELVVMKEYGNGNSWEVTLVFSSAGYLGSIIPFFRTKEGEVVVGECKSCDCCYGIEAYDVHGNFLRQIRGWSLDAYDGFNFILYEESWHSPTDMKTLFFHKLGLFHH